MAVPSPGPCWPGIYLPRKMKVEPELSLVNLCTCKFIQVLLQCTVSVVFIIMFPSNLRRLSSESFNKFYTPVAIEAVSLFSIAYQRPLVIKHGLNIRLNINKTSCSHDCIHALLLSRITVPMYLCRRIQPSPRSSLFAGKLYLSRIKCESC